MSASNSTIRAVIITAPHSGAGKTTVALGLMASLKKRGLKVAPFKIGPDFIDPGHHGVICGSISRNLDGWMLSRETNLDCFYTHCDGADIAVIEGVMGLFDGVSGNSEEGSTAQMAKWLKAPVLLVVDAFGMARSGAALVQGFENFDDAVDFSGVIFNRLSGTSHLNFLRTALNGKVSMPCLGGLDINGDIHLPERHLGLVTADDHPLNDKWIDQLADTVERQVNLDLLLERLPDIPIGRMRPCVIRAGHQNSARIGWARDRAFCFYYADNLDLLKHYGAELVPFSPLRDRSLPPDLDGIYLGGGYPEMVAGQLADNASMRRQVRQASEKGMPIYGECGGFMYLCAAIRDINGTVHEMTGCFPMQVRMYSRLQRLGYREIIFNDDSVLGPRRQTGRGHEFRYSDLIPLGAAAIADQAYRMTDHSVSTQSDPPAKGYLSQRTLGSYIHLHFGSQPEMAATFVKNCRQYRQERLRYNDTNSLHD